MRTDIELSSLAHDDPEFVRIVSAFISHHASELNTERVAVIHIDNWFGGRWLGFCGKLLGMAGVRSRYLTEKLVVPPFHPNRVLSMTVRTWNRKGFWEDEVCDPNRFHRHRPSEFNLDNTIYRQGLYCWYSGNTAANAVGSLMVYHISTGSNNAWYAMFNRTDRWKFCKSRHISPNHCLEIVESVQRQNAA